VELGPALPDGRSLDPQALTQSLHRQGAADAGGTALGPIREAAQLRREHAAVYNLIPEGLEQLLGLTVTLKVALQVGIS
jgi:hypothetical protein